MDELMDTKTKLILGFVLGLVGYVAYTKLKRTQSVQLDASQNVDPTASIAGLH